MNPQPNLDTPNNLEWLDDVLDMEMEHLKDDDGNDLYLKEDALILRDKQKLAITAKINEIEKTAYNQCLGEIRSIWG